MNGPVCGPGEMESSRSPSRPWDAIESRAALRDEKSPSVPTRKRPERDAHEEFAQTAGKDLLIKANGQFIGSYSIEDTVNCAQGFELKDSKCVWAGSAIIAPSTSTPTINTPMTFSLQGVLDGVKSVLWTIGDTITHMVTDALDAIFGHPVKVVTNLGDAISNTFTELGNKIAKATLLDAEGKDIANVTPVTVSVGCPSGKIVQDGIEL